MSIKTDEAKLAFAQRLNEAMESCGHQLRGRARLLSKQFMVSDKAASKWLKGEAIPETSKIPELSRFLGVNGEWLLSGSGEMKPILDSSKLGEIISTLQKMEKEQKLSTEILSMLQHTLNTMINIQDNQDKIAAGQDPAMKKPA